MRLSGLAKLIGEPIALFNDNTILLIPSGFKLWYKLLPNSTMKQS